MNLFLKQMLSLIITCINTDVRKVALLTIKIIILSDSSFLGGYIYFYICYIHFHILFYSFRLAGRKVSINKTFCVVILYIKGLLQQRDQSTCNFWSCTFTKFRNVWYFFNIFITSFANVNWCTMMDFSIAYNYLSNEKEPVQWVWS